MYIAPIIACVSAGILTALQSKQIRQAIDSKLGDSIHKTIALWSLFIGAVSCMFLNETYGITAGLTFMGYMISSIKVMDKEDLEYKITQIGLTTLVCSVLGLIISGLQSLRFSKV